MRIFNPAITLEQAKQRVRDEGFTPARAQESRGMVYVESVELYPSSEPRLIVTGYVPDAIPTAHPSTLESR